MLEEFKNFAFKGNAFDLAVGVIIGTAFGKIVASIVDDLIMPVIGAIFGGLDFNNYFFGLSSDVTAPTLEAAKAQGRARFEQFVEQLGRHILRGRSLVREVYEELEPDPQRLDEIAAQVEAQEREQQQQFDGEGES